MNTLLLPFYNFRQRRLRAGWRLLFQFLAFVFSLIVLMVPVMLVVFAVRLDPNGDAVTWIGGFAQCFAMVSMVLLASWLLDRRPLHSLGFPRSGGLGRGWMLEAFLGFALGAIAMLWIFGVEWQLGWLTVERVGTDSVISVQALLLQQLGFLSLMIAVGISEEMLSRGYHMKNLSEGFRCLGIWPAVILSVILSSAFFGLLHAGNENATWTSNLGVALAGIMLGTARVATGSLAAPIGLHISWNLFQGPILGFPVSGNAMNKSVVAIEQGGDPVWTGGQFGPEAGLIGCIAVVALTLAFVVWGLAKSRPRRAAAALAHFRIAKSPERPRAAPPRVDVAADNDDGRPVKLPT